MHFNGDSDTFYSDISGFSGVVIDNEMPVYVRVCDAGDIGLAVQHASAAKQQYPQAQFALLCLDWLEADEMPHGFSPFPIVDVQSIFRRFWPSLSTTRQSPLVVRMLNEIGDALKHRLSTIEPGRSDFRQYEKLVDDVFTYLFHPDLTHIESQAATYMRTSISDSIFRITATVGFWEEVRSLHAHSSTIVLEAKNLEASPQAAEVHQLAGYLNPHGKGCFGILVSRQPASETAKQMIRTLRSGFGNMSRTILTFDDADLNQLIDLRGNSGVWQCNQFMYAKLWALVKSV